MYVLTHEMIQELIDIKNVMGRCPLSGVSSIKNCPVCDKRGL